MAASVCMSEGVHVCVVTYVASWFKSEETSPLVQISSSAVLNSRGAPVWAYEGG